MTTPADNARQTPWHKRSRDQRQAVLAERQAKLADSEARRTQAFAGVLLEPKKGTVSYKREKVTLPAIATVESAGDLRRRVTATRLVLTGVFALALKKKQDDRELFLTIEGADGASFVVDVDPKKQLEARRFAAAVNSAHAE